MNPEDFEVLLPTPDPEPLVVPNLGTITQVSPLRVKLDIDEAASNSTPDSLISSLRVGDRVWCVRTGTRLLVVGRIGGDGPPTGTIAMWLADQPAPIAAGWLFCQGQSYSPTAFPRLFALIGNRYGGTTSVPLLPNLQGRFPVGADWGQAEFNALGKTGGEKAHTLTPEEMTHRHHAGELRAAIGASNGDVNALSYAATIVNSEYQTTTAYTVFGNGGPTGAQRSFNHHTSVGGWTHWNSDAYGGASAHNNLPPYFAVDFIIKAI